MGDQAGPSQSELSTQSNRKRGRGCTRMKKLKVKTAQGQKLQIEFQPSGIPSGENAKKFKYQVASFARKFASILINDWDVVPDDAKDDIWKSINVIFNCVCHYCTLILSYTNSYICCVLQDNWDIPNENIVKVKKKTMIYARGRWRAFKNSLTSRYLFKGDLSHKSPTEAYDFIDGRTWKEFVKTRDDPSFLVSLIYYLVLQLNVFLVYIT